jgi:hypothetical protein
MASAFAESPSVKIKVHYDDLSVPAALASSNFGTSNNCLFFFPPVPSARLSYAFCRASTDSTTYSTIGLARIFFINSWLKVQVEPNVLGLEVSVSFV